MANPRFMTGSIPSGLRGRGPRPGGRKMSKTFFAPNRPAASCGLRQNHRFQTGGDRDMPRGGARLGAGGRESRRAPSFCRTLTGRTGMARARLTSPRRRCHRRPMVGTLTRSSIRRSGRTVTGLWTRWWLISNARRWTGRWCWRPPVRPMPPECGKHARVTRRHRPTNSARRASRCSGRGSTLPS